MPYIEGYIFIYLFIFAFFKICSQFDDRWKGAALRGDDCPRIYGQFIEWESSNYWLKKTDADSDAHRHN